ncbi:MAG: DUF5309 family protein [Clostridiales bacterium]
MANIDQTRSTLNINQTRRVVDMADKIALLDPNIAPFLGVLKLLKKDTRTVFSPKFEWLEDDYLGIRTKVANAITAVTTGALVVADTSIFRVNDVLNIPAVGENMLVTAVTTGTNTLTVVRGFGSQAAAAAIEAGAEVIVVGSAMPENSGNRGAKSTQEMAKYNYTQIFRTPVAMSATEAASKLYGGKDRSYQRRKAAAEHKRDIAHALYFGQKKEIIAASSNMPQRTTGGLVEFMRTGSNTVAFDPTTNKLTYNNFDSNVAQKLFAHGSDNKLLIAGPKLASAINSWAVGKLITEVGADKTYGIRVSKLATSYGDLPIVFDPLIAGDYSGYGFALDLDHVRYAYLEGRDTKLYTDIQNNDVDGVIDEYKTECGLEVKNANTHVLVTGAYVSAE